MFSPVPSRLLTGLATFAIIAGVLTPSVAASADDDTAPVADETSVEAPADTTVLEQEAAEAAVPEAEGRTITLAGAITSLVDESNALPGEHDDHAHAPVDYAASPIQLFRISGHGMLSIDVSGIDLSQAPEGILDLEFAVPAGLDLGETAESRYAALRAYTLDVAPLVATGYAAVDSYGPVASLVNQIPVAGAEHTIYAVLVTPADVPGTAVAANQTAAKVQASVAHSSQLWSDQSGGLITFSLAGTASWYKSAYNCNVGADPAINSYNADHIWAEAAAKATTQLGYKDGPNRHLVLFFPSGSNCGSAAGLASYGTNVNTGGPAWVVGTDGAYEKSTLAHELGHNMTYGHANWIDCTIANPQLGSGLSAAGCSKKEYGDAVDIMGGGVGGTTGGSLSSPSAIRSSIWPSAAYTYAPPSKTTSYTLNTVTSGAGLRAVVVEDNVGDNYFVEFRNNTGRDAQFASVTCPWGSASSVCNSATGVRILRQEHSFYDYSGMQHGYVKGRATDATFLIGRTIGGVKKGAFTSGESYSTNGVTISVTAITSTTATVSITRPATSLASGIVRVTRSTHYDNRFRAGDVFTALIGSAWKAESYKYQWYRSGKAISGATRSSYTLTGSDVGKSIKVKVTGKVGSKSKSVTDPSSFYSGYGPVLKGVMSQGTVSINANAPTFTAVPADWTTPSVTYKYQWLRNGAKISGATKSTYTPGSSDSGKSLAVTLTTSKSGYTSRTATSVAKNYTVLVTGGAASITGTAKVGATLASSSTLTFAKQVPAAAIPTPVLTRQWYRSGKAITGATGVNYTLTGADYGKTISVRISGSTPGWAAGSATSVATGKVAKGTIAGSLSAATVAKTVPSGILLTASLGAGVVTEPGVSYSYQWYRGSTAIKKATKSTYAPTSSDYGQLVSVRVAVKKTNYDTAVISSTGVNYSVVATPVIPVIAGQMKIGAVLGVNTRTYSPSATATYQWYRDGKAIAGATAISYITQPADKGRSISVKVTATAAGFLTSTATSAATQKLQANEQQGALTVPSMTKDAATITFTAAPGVTEPGVKVAYQWYRGTSAISKATKSTYKVTSTSYGKDIKVRVTTTKADYTTVVAFTAPKSVSVMPVSMPKPTINDTTPAVGQTLSVTLPLYSQSINTPVYQWYASGKAISGATGSTFIVQSAQKGKTISVKVVASATGYLSSTLTSVATSKVVAF